MRFWYFGLEPLNARYTQQLGEVWVPAAFADVNLDGAAEFVDVPRLDVSREIGTGSVLDAVNRNRVALRQCDAMLRAMADGRVSDGDVVYLQDYWTPGIEAVLYAAHQKGLRLRLYARCWAQSVDPYDFTYPMRRWMRPVELGWSEAMEAVFVASSVHRDQLRAAGVRCPVHVVGLPFHLPDGPVPSRPREKVVMFTSRLNAEKNPWFMLDVAERFLGAFPDWSWRVTTGAAAFATELPGLLAACAALEAVTGGRFRMVTTTKAEYYGMLSRAAIQFNSSLQDYVAFTHVEAAAAGCDLCYPDFSSFAECVDSSRRYHAFDADDAFKVLMRAACSPGWHVRVPRVCHMGLRVELAVMLRGYGGPELNVWHHPTSHLAACGLL